MMAINKSLFRSIAFYGLLLITFLYLFYRASVGTQSAAAMKQTLTVHYQKELDRMVQNYKDMVSTKYYQQELVVNKKINHLEDILMDSKKEFSSLEPVYITTAFEKDIPDLRNLVGSLHLAKSKRNQPLPRFIIYGIDIPTSLWKEFSLWENVEYNDVKDTLLVGSTSVIKPPTTASNLDNGSAKREDADVSLIVLKAIKKALKINKVVVYLSCQLNIRLDSLDQLQEIVLKDDFLLLRNEQQWVFPYDLAAFVAGQQPADLFINKKLQCINDYQCPSVLINKVETAKHKLRLENHNRLKEKSLGSTIRHRSPDDQFMCFIHFRDDILYNIDDKVDVVASAGTTTPQTSKIKIAIGMPTKSPNSIASYKDISPLKTFIPSFLNTVTEEEWTTFDYTIYLGFDEGDPILDNPANLGLVTSDLNGLLQNRPVAIKYIKFPRSNGWVTYIWNGLFVRAFKDGCQYFYQVNDDLQLNTPNWTTYFVNTLRANRDYGVVGPWDPRLGGRILTQSFVSKQHYSIFGRLYPIEIKDWYSDNWISNVYGTNNTFSSPNITASNLVNFGTRYTICNRPKYELYLKNGKKMLQEYSTKGFGEVYI